MTYTSSASYEASPLGVRRYVPLDLSLSSEDQTRHLEQIYDEWLDYHEENLDWQGLVRNAQQSSRGEAILLHELRGFLASIVLDSEAEPSFANYIRTEVAVCDALETMEVCTDTLDKVLEAALEAANSAMPPKQQTEDLDPDPSTETPLTPKINELETIELPQSVAIRDTVSQIEELSKVKGVSKRSSLEAINKTVGKFHGEPLTKQDVAIVMPYLPEWQFRVTEQEGDAANYIFERTSAGERFKELLPKTVVFEGNWIISRNSGSLQMTMPRLRADYIQKLLDIEIIAGCG